MASKKLKRANGTHATRVYLAQGNSLQRFLAQYNQVPVVIKRKGTVRGVIKC